jgi:hypothetical protein
MAATPARFSGPAFKFLASYPPNTDLPRMTPPLHPRYACLNTQGEARHESLRRHR